MEHICENCGEYFSHSPIMAQVEGKGQFFKFCTHDCREVFQEIYVWQGDNLALNTD